ncbi:MAG TPA: nucleoside deaminase [Sedimentisphaerales bacterium]|nr:nucleoside deaminase [Sedimentisphaerales bacterium]HRS11605.1 nucleoside deaminase [Sedimentisphaerales bacterium]HRV48268.1 nucleoside deaminase [Sedimentisphaerales bacterium]
MVKTNRRCDEVVLQLPLWLRQAAGLIERPFGSAEAKMRFVIDLAQRNVEHKTGGPFGAAVFEARSGRLLAPGVNLVEPLHCSIAHAEMVAIALAQQAMGSYDLGAGGMVYELVTSTEPCAMCLGAIPWSGVRRVLCGARGEDACAIGFDEGAKPGDWVGALRSRGIEVVRDICRDEARAVLRHYLAAGGRIYNARGEG